ncbi:transcriptional regulator [Acinetobacter phage Scipio]|nr:transcriptional regulator [Acinetobacter phage Scipio]
MKFENMYIECENTVQLNHAIKIAEKKGYKEWGGIERKEGNLYLSLYEDGDYSVVSVCQTNPKSYNDFILENKEVAISVAETSENEMIKKIHQAKKELGLNNSELSLKMGKSRPYIAKMLNQPQSEKVQKKVIKQLDDILDTENYLKPYAEQAKKMQEDAKIMSENTNITINNDPDLFNQLSIERHQNSLKDKEISDLKKVIESKDLAISGLIKQNDEAKKIHDQDEKTIKFQEKKYLDLVEYNEQVKREMDYFVNKYKQSESDVASLKSKIKRERIIILIVIVILTALFFLKGSIGG